MTCPHFGASLHESVQRCPYCDSFIEPEKDREEINQDPYAQKKEQLRKTFQMSGPDEPQAIFVVLSLIIPVLGFILGILHISGGKPKCGKVYLIVGAVAFFLVFCGTGLLPVIFSAFSFSKMG